MPPKNVNPTGRKMGNPIIPIKLNGKLTCSSGLLSSGYLTGFDKTEIEDYTEAREAVDAKIESAAHKKTRKK